MLTFRITVDTQPGAQHGSNLIPATKDGGEEQEAPEGVSRPHCSPVTGCKASCRITVSS